MTWQPSERYPDPSIVALDPSFKKYHLALSAVERLWTGSRWGEGPVWLGDARCLLWSDIPNNRVLKWDETTGTVSEWRKPSNNANGHTRDRQGRIIACEHAGRRVVRFEYDGSITVIAETLPGQEAEQPERRGGEVRRQHLVHRPALRHLCLLRGQQAAGRAAAHQCLPRRWPEPARSPWSPTTSTTRTAWPSAPTKACSTSSKAGRSRATSWPTTWSAGRSWRSAGSSTPASRARRRTASASTSTATSGAAGA